MMPTMDWFRTDNDTTIQPITTRDYMTSWTEDDVRDDNATMTSSPMPTADWMIDLRSSVTYCMVVGCILFTTAFLAAIGGYIHVTDPG